MMASFNNDFMSISALEEKVKEQNEVKEQTKVLKWQDLQSKVWYYIVEVNEVDGKTILTLDHITRRGDITRVWACNKLNKEKAPLKGTYIKSIFKQIGFGQYQSNMETLSYDLGIDSNSDACVFKSYYVFGIFS